VLGAGQVVQVKGRYRHEIPLDLHAALPECAKGTQLEPALPRPSPHEPGCWCLICWNAGIEYGIYLHNKRMEEL
jgi:hypothetical protein